MPRLSSPFRNVVAGLVLAVAVAGCDHVTDPDGPNLNDRFGPFRLVEPLAASSQTVDFAAGQSIVFTAQFNKQTDWVLEITGTQSGAVKRIEGFSRELTAENARWDGGTTDLPLFRAEPVTAALFFPSEAGSDTTRATTSATSIRSYPGEVVTGFEESDDATLFLGNFEFDFDLSLTGVNNDVPAAEGERFYRLRGTDNTLDNFFVGLLQITSPSADGYFAVPTTIPEDLFLNAFLYNFEAEFTIVILEVVADANGNGRFDDGTDTIIGSGDIRLDEPGWTAFSRSAADFGLTEAQASQIVAVRAVLISDNTAQPTSREPVDFGVDYITFTAGGPLQL
ncbi:MAG: hypothetical protein AAF845_09210 [Bacteroidota bacterium]